MKINSMLRCPACKSDLSESDYKFICANVQCGHANSENYFSCIDGAPVLVSEILCDTVCSSSDVSSYIPRSGDCGALKLLKKHIVGASKTTKSNIANFIGRLEISNRKPLVLIIGSGEIGSGSDQLYSSRKIHNWTNENNLKDRGQLNIMGSYKL